MAVLREGALSAACNSSTQATCVPSGEIATCSKSRTLARAWNAAVTSDELRAVRGETRNVPIARMFKAVLGLFMISVHVTDYDFRTLELLLRRTGEIENNC